MMLAGCQNFPVRHHRRHHHWSFVIIGAHPSPSLQPSPLPDLALRHCPIIAPRLGFTAPLRRRSPTQLRGATPSPPPISAPPTPTPVLPRHLLPGALTITRTPLSPSLWPSPSPPQLCFLALHRCHRLRCLPELLPDSASRRPINADSSTSLSCYLTPGVRVSYAAPSFHRHPELLLLR
jgi:hypothetical protein